MTVVLLLLFLLGLAIFPVGLILMWRDVRPAPRLPARAPLDTGPAEPCWTEAIGSDGRYSYARAHCPNDLLMEMDARAARGDFPIPKQQSGG
jgi:hypothetical protein